MSAKNQKNRKEAEELKRQKAAEETENQAAEETENQATETSAEDQPQDENQGLINGIDDPQFDNIEWLVKESPSRFFVSNNVSSKYDPKREPEILFGLDKLAEIMPEHLPLTLRMLAKWWEVKPARASIKKMIDEEAEAQGYDRVTYMQEVLRNKVDELNAIKGCIDRLSYCITYFKPRKDFVSKVPMKQIKCLDGNIYELPITTLTEIKEKYAGNREKISEAIIAVGKKVVNEIDEL